MKLSLIPIIFFSILCLIIPSCVKKNHPPEILDQQFSVLENSGEGTVVGKVVATDEDNDTTLTYTIISGNENNAFEISPTSGIITVHNGDEMDFETNPSFTLIVEVRDSKNAGASSDITINLEDVAPPTEGLILYLPFDGNIKDSSSSMNDGIDYSSDNYVAGRWDQGLDFNGTTDYIQLSSTINSSNVLSFSFWIRSRGVNGAENNGVVISKYNMTTQARCFMIYSFGSSTTRSDNRLSAAFYKYGTSSSYHDNTKSYLEPDELIVYPTDPSYWTILNPRRLETGTWTHSVVNVTATEIEVWLNGILCTKKRREYTTYFNSQYEPVYIGNNLAAGEGSNNHFNGTIDELRVYDRTLSEEEIKTLFKEK